MEIRGHIVCDCPGPHTHFLRTQSGFTRNVTRMLYWGGGGVVMNLIVEYCISNCPHHDRQLESGLKNTTLSIFENSEFLQKKGGQQGSYVPLMAT